MTDNRIMVAVRIRPLSFKEKTKGDVTTISKVVNEQTVMVYDPTEDFLENILRKERQREKLFEFDCCFDEFARQEMIFDKTVRFLVDSVIEGYNGTVFAYGATGAGKTHTMMGKDADPGIMPLALAYLFSKKSQSQDAVYDISLSYLEIYNENIRDLLSGKQEFLDLREDTSRGVVVAGITYVSAKSPEEVLGFLSKGNKNRSQEATGANAVSSRSHAVMQVFVSQRSTKGPTTYRFSKLSMIDLAGSERAADTQNRGQRMIEGANINRSLLALGNCINSLVDPTKRSKYVNYRDSKLTRLLKDSLGGNCRTVMIANISPASSHFEETMNTLKYASRAASIRTQAVNTAIDDEEYQAVLQQFQQEAQHIKADPALLATIQQKLSKDVKADKSIWRTRQQSNVPLQDHSILARKQLEEIFREQLDVQMRLLQFQETEQLAQKTIQSRQDELATCDKSQSSTIRAMIGDLQKTAREAHAKRVGLEQVLIKWDEKMKTLVQANVQHDAILQQMIKTHYLEMENLGLDLSLTIHKNLLSVKELQIESYEQLLQVCHKIIGKQHKLLADHEVKIPADVTEDLKLLDELEQDRIESLDMSIAMEDFKVRHVHHSRMPSKGPDDEITKLTSKIHEIELKHSRAASVGVDDDFRMPTREIHREDKPSYTIPEDPVKRSDAVKRTDSVTDRKSDLSKKPDLPKKFDLVTERNTDPPKNIDSVTERKTEARKEELKPTKKDQADKLTKQDRAIMLKQAYLQKPKK